MAKMTEEEAKKYLKRKGKDVTDDSVAEICKSGKIFGDPVAEICQFLYLAMAGTRKVGGLPANARSTVTYEKGKKPKIAKVSKRNDE